MEFATLIVNPATGEPKSKVYRPAKVGALLKKHDPAKKDKDTEMNTAWLVFALGRTAASAWVVKRITVTPPDLGVAQTAREAE